MRKLLLFIVFTLMIFGCNNQQSKHIKLNIGVIIPLTGDYSKIGKDLQKAIVLAKQDAIRNGLIKNEQINIIFEDNKLDATTTINAYNKLKAINNIDVVITVTSKCILALKPIANKDEVILLNASAISTEIEDSIDYCFSIIPNAASEATFLSSYILNKQEKSTSIIYRNDQSGNSFYSAFSKHYESNGGIIPVVEAHPTNTTDFRTIIAKIKTDNTQDALFMPSLGVETAHFLKQSKELNLNIPIYTYETINQPNALDIAGNLIDRVEFVSPTFQPNDSAFILFREDLMASYGSDEINFYMISHYNAFMLCANLLNKGFKTSQEFKKEIPNITGEFYLGSPFRIDSIGNAHTQLSIYGYRNKSIYQLN